MKNTFLLITFFYLCSHALMAQDTLSGNFATLEIKSGIHVIKEVVMVTGALVIQPGAKIEISDAGVIVCAGPVTIGAIASEAVDIYGKVKAEGIGLVIKGMDSSSVIISNTNFKNLQLPIQFEFGWHRQLVNIHHNQFVNNIGRASVIQVLNPPFNFQTGKETSSFYINNNLFTGNSGAVYFEDLSNDHTKILITGNTFAGTNLYGFKNYNIATNFIYGRADNLQHLFTAKIEGNSFAFNHLYDNLTDTIVHEANFGVYGTEKTYTVKNNYWGTADTQLIYKGIYDQVLNYNSPKVDLTPILLSPADSIPAHIYAIQYGSKNTPLTFDYSLQEGSKSFSLLSNAAINYQKKVLQYIYFKDDSTLVTVDTIMRAEIQEVSQKNGKMTISGEVGKGKREGYFRLKELTDARGKIVPDVMIGSQAFLIEMARRKVQAEKRAASIAMDTAVAKVPARALDSVKTTFQKLETPLKSRIEVGIGSGLALFNGSISTGNLFKNDKNLYNALNIRYNLFSNISANLAIASFKLSGSDLRSDNNDEIARGMSFSTSMLAVSPSINYDYVDNRSYTKSIKLRPSVGVGLDLFSFSPTGVYKGQIYKLQPLGTGGQLTDSLKKGAYSLMSFGYFVSAQLKYQFSRKNSVGIHISYHRSMTDYLDDLGADQYPDVSKMLGSDQTNGQAAVYFANPTSKRISGGELRSSPSKPTDKYLIIGISFSRKLFN